MLPIQGYRVNTVTCRSPVTRGGGIRPGLRLCSVRATVLGTAWQLFKASDYGIVRYEVAVPVSFPREHAFGLQLRLARWHWRITSVNRPEQIRFLLADEIIKSVRPPQTH